MKTTKWLVLAAGLMMALPVAAEPLEQGNWEGSVGIAFLGSTDADFKGGTRADFDSDEGFRAAFDYSLTDALQVGGSWSIGQRSYEADIVGDVLGEETSFR